MKQGKKTAILALLVSVAVHGVFFAAAPYIILQGMRQVRDKTRMMFRLREVEKRTAMVALFEEAQPPVPAIKLSRQVSPLNGRALQKMMLEKKPGKDIPLEAKKEKLREERLDEILPPDIKEVDAGETLKTRAEKDARQAAPERRPVAEHLLSEELVSYKAAPAALRQEPDYGAEQPGFDRPEAETDVWQPAAAETFQAGEKEIAAIQEEAQVGEYGDISEFLDVTVRTYTDPDTEEKYFKLFINVKEGSRLEVIPKEVIFLIDSSKSITEKKLSYIKAGVLDSLKGLNPKDCFNVVAFRGDLVRFKKGSVPATERTIEEVALFIRQLKAVGQTDVERALLDIIKESVSFHPSYIVLVTDGRPTTGVTDSRRIIQQITRAGGMERPIFCFGGGMRVNRYLLDFISHQNRAWSRFAVTTYDIRRDFSEFYREIKDPLLLDVRYRLSGLDAGEVYPKYLSDFYQGRPFTLYGRFTGEDVFSMQLLGEINGATKEFIFKRSLGEAAKGGADIAREWAFRKIYYLISRNTMGIGDPALLRAEIDILSRKYGITTPYDIEESD